MHKLDLLKLGDERQAYGSQVKLFQPTVVSVLSLGSQVSLMMREENRQKRLEALRKRAQKG